jgi:outer membrane receptor protein involved in Fe transport
LNWDQTEAQSQKSISACRELDSAFGEDADMSPLVIDHHGFVMDQTQFTQELQLSGAHDRLDWTGGLYFFRESGGIHDLVPLGAGLLQVDGPNTLENVSAAAFGQLTFRILAAWSVTLGARYTEEDKEFHGRQRSQRLRQSRAAVELRIRRIRRSIFRPASSSRTSRTRRSGRVPSTALPTMCSSTCLTPKDSSPAAGTPAWA